MDAFQVTSLILLSVITIALIAWLVIDYKSIVRRDEAAKSLQSSLESVHPRLAEMEAALKGYLPAVERNTGEAAKQLIEVAGIIRSLSQTEGESSKQLIEISGLIRSMAQAQLENLTHVRSVLELSGSSNQNVKKLITLSEELNASTRLVKVSVDEGVLATNSLNQAAAQKLTGVAQELAELRRELNEVTRF